MQRFAHKFLKFLSDRRPPSSHAEFGLRRQSHHTGIRTAPLLSLRRAVKTTGIKVPSSCIQLASERRKSVEGWSCALIRFGFECVASF